MKTTVNVLLLVSLVTGCAADSSDDADEQGGAMAMTEDSTLLKDVAKAAVAVELQIRSSGRAKASTVIAAPARFEKVLQSLSQRTDEDKEKTCTETDEQVVRFLDVKGAAVGLATLSCGYGKLKVGSRELAVESTLDFHAAVKEMPTPRDALWGITSISVDHLESEDRMWAQPSEIGRLIAAVDLDTTPTTPITWKDCYRTYSIRFKRNDTTAAELVTCTDYLTRSTRMDFYASMFPSVGGTVQVNTTEFARFNH